MAAKHARGFTVAILSLLAVVPAARLLAADARGVTGTLSFVRLYSTPDGQSHFVDETLHLAPLGGEGLEAELAVHRIGDVQGALFAMLPAGTTEDWHVAPRRQFMICLRGIVEVTAADGEKRRILPGQFVLLEDTTGKGHVTHAAGHEDHVALAIPLPHGVLTRK